jgi:hypothetical protein
LTAWKRFESACRCLAAGFFIARKEHPKTLVPPYFPAFFETAIGRGKSLTGKIAKENAMRVFLLSALIALSLVSLEAKAQERAADAAIGAVSGAVVLGPVGAVAGAIVGFTAGPSIARSFGMHPSPPPRAQVQRTSQTSSRSEPQSTGTITPLPPSRPSQAPANIQPPGNTQPPGQPQASNQPQASGKMPPMQSLE